MLKRINNIFAIVTKVSTFFSVIGNNVGENMRFGMQGVGDTIVYNATLVCQARLLRE